MIGASVACVRRQYAAAKRGSSSLSGLLTRYDKAAVSFMAELELVAVGVWLQDDESRSEA
jgi:hypothetical protein